MDNEWWLNQFLQLRKSWHMLKNCTDLLEERDAVLLDFIKTLCPRDDEIGKQAREALYKAQNIKIKGIK